jgi:flagellar assembly protein FliH
MAQVIRSVEVRDEPVPIRYGIAPEPPAPPPQVAEPVVEDPTTTLEELRKQAFEDGYRDGYDAGAAKAGEERAALAERFKRLIASVEQALAAQIEGAEDAMVEIAYAAACKVIGDAALTEAGVRGAVRTAMQGVRAREVVAVRIALADREMLGAEVPGEVLADERVALGGCIVETSGGSLDARLDTQLRLLADTLARAREERA